MNTIGIDDYSKILQTYRNKLPTNFVSLSAGKYNLTKKWFNRVYLPLHTQFKNNCGSLVFKVPPTKKIPIIIDLDVNFAEKPIKDVQAIYLQVVERILECFTKLHDRNVHVIATRRPEIYKKNDFFRGGLHVYILGDYSLEDSINLRNIVLEEIDLKNIFEKLAPVQNKNSNIYDIALAERRNGVLLIGSNKPNTCSKPHYIFCYGTWFGLWQANQPQLFQNPKWAQDEKLKTAYKTMLKSLYAFIWKDDKKQIWLSENGELTKPPPQKKINEKKPYAFIWKDDKKQIWLSENGELTKPPPQKKINEKKPIFSLKEFLRVTNKYVPDNTEYKQLLVFFASKNLDPTTTCNMCNAAWMYKSRETETFMTNVTSFDVTKASVIRYLKSHAVCEWSESKIFGSEKTQTKEMYFNDMKDLEVAQGKTWTLKEVHAYFKSVFSFIFGTKTSCFLYKEWSWKYFSELKIKKTNIVVTGLIPYGNSALQRNVLLEPTKARLWKILLKIKPPKTPKGFQKTELDIFQKSQAKFLKSQVLIKKGFDTVSAKEITNLIGKIPAQRTNMGVLFEEYHQDGFLPRYFSYKYVPYLAEDPTPADTINCFTGFSLQQFRNTDVDITKTNLWTWLTVAWCNKEPRKIDWLCDYIAHKLQKPARKIKKMLVAFGTKTGTGKTTMRYFLSALFDQSVLFIDSLNEFTGTFTGQQFGKLFCLLDDVEKWKKADSAKLKSRITSDTYTHRVMRNDPKEMPCYLDLICTSNSRTPCFVGENDRRTELIVINESLKAEKSKPSIFWNGLYKELEDTKIMGGFFEFFATRDLSSVVFNENYRFSEKALALQKGLSLKSTYDFLVNCFADAEFLIKPRANYSEQIVTQKDDIEFKLEKHTRFIKIKSKYMFKLYLRWAKDSGMYTKVKRATFLNDMEDLALRSEKNSRGRYTIGGTRGVSGYKFSKQMLEDKLSTRLGCEFEIDEYVLDDPHWKNASSFQVQDVIHSV